MKLTLKYRPLLWPFKRTLNIDVPTEWRDCTQGQLLAVLRAGDAGATDAGFISQYCNIPLLVARRIPKFSQIMIIEEITKMQKSKFTGRFYVSCVICGKEKLYAPAYRMKGLTFGQFIFVDAWFNDEDPASRAKFITHLYLPKNEKFDDEKCLARAEKLKISQHIIEGILLNYRMFYDYFAEAYPLLFHAADPEPDPKKKTSDYKYDPRGWLKVYESVIGKDIINADKYADVPVNQMFRFLTEQLKQQARQTRKN
jgi:hypothetical protein